MPARDFTASYDRTTKWLSAVVCLLLLLVSALMIATPRAAAGIAIISILSMACAGAYSPRGYSVGDGMVIVKRLIGNIRVPLDNVQALRTSTSDDFRGCIRLWGSGGLFGYYGLFRTSVLGRCTWYVTDRSRTVVLITAAKTVLFSPDDVDGFLLAIRQQTAAPETGAAMRLSPDRSTGSQLAPKIVATLALGAAGLIAALLTARLLFPALTNFSPGPPPYTLTEGALSIQDRFFPVTIGAASTNVEGIRVVDLDRETGWRPKLRVGGFANSHYQSGWFRAENGTRMRLYRERSAERLVLLPAKGGDAPVLLQVPGAERFVEQIRREWGGR